MLSTTRTPHTLGLAMPTDVPISNAVIYVGVDYEAACARELAQIMPAFVEAVGSAAKAFAKLGAAVRPAIAQAVRELNDCGYVYDEQRGVFVRTYEDNPIPAHRVLRYIQRSPQNRRRVKQWRKVARRARLAAAREDAVSEVLS